jgi:hypothetical protein
MKNIPVRRFPFAVVAVVSCLALLTPLALAHHQYLTQYANNLIAQGYYFLERQHGDLDEGYMQTYYRSFVIGGRYAVIGTCDEDCTDLDLKVFDPSGNLVGQDTDPDDNPLVVFTAKRSGQYRYQVIMETCNSEPCGYGAGVLIR